jgi:hypothetical protein
MTPEIIDHRTALGIPALCTVAYSGEVARDDRVYTLFMACLDKVGDISVELLPKSAAPDTVQS